MEGGGVVFAFYVLSAVTLVAAGGVMMSRNLLHAVLFLILTFVGIAGFFVLLSADFIAMAQVIIYVGAIAVLVLFAILLTPLKIKVILNMLCLLIWQKPIIAWFWLMPLVMNMVAM